MPVSNFIWSYILVYLLLGAGLLFTIMTRGMQFRLFRHMAYVTFTARGAGDGISGFQAFATSMAARVGTGNLAGVALALWIGGPGAILDVGDSVARFCNVLYRIDAGASV